MRTLLLELRPSALIEARLADLEERLEGLRGMILGGAAFAVLLGLLVAVLLARRITSPLRGVREAAAAAIEAGLFNDETVPVSIPPDAVDGATYARFRISSQGGPGPAGPAIASTAGSGARSRHAPTRPSRSRSVHTSARAATS